MCDDAGGRASRRAICLESGIRLGRPLVPRTSGSEGSLALPILYARACTEQSRDHARPSKVTCRQCQAHPRPQASRSVLSSGYIGPPLRGPSLSAHEEPDGSPARRRPAEDPDGKQRPSTAAVCRFLRCLLLRSRLRLLPCPAGPQQHRDRDASIFIQSRFQRERLDK